MGESIKYVYKNKHINGMEMDSKILQKFHEFNPNSYIIKHTTKAH